IGQQGLLLVAGHARLCATATCPRLGSLTEPAGADVISASTSQQPPPRKPARRGGEFFLRPASPAQRRYEALRAYLADGLPADQVAARFDYTPAGLQSLVRDFRAGKLDLFPQRRPGPKRAPAKDAARARVIDLRLAGHSIDEISAALAAEGTPLNRTGVSEIIAEEGLPRIWRRPEHERR